MDFKTKKENLIKEFNQLENRQIEILAILKFIQELEKEPKEEKPKEEEKK